MAISLDPDGKNFISRAGSDQIALSEDDVLALGQSAIAYRQSIMSRRHGDAVFATPVSGARALWDALTESILVEMRFEPIGNLIFEVPPDRSKELAEKIQSLLVDKPDAQLTRQ